MKKFLEDVKLVVWCALEMLVPFFLGLAPIVYYLHFYQK